MLAPFAAQKKWQVFSFPDKFVERSRRNVYRTFKTMKAIPLSPETGSMRSDTRGDYVKGHRHDNLCVFRVDQLCCALRLRTPHRLRRVCAWGHAEDGAICLSSKHRGR